MRVGFLGNYTKEWMGGVNYLKNLLYAIHTYQKNEITPVVFVAKDTDPMIRECFAPYAQVIEVSTLTRKSISWFIWRATRKIFKRDLWLELCLRRYQIEVFSHSDFYPTFTHAVNWVPDFQHVHLPQMFSEGEVIFRNQAFFRASRYANLMILSSEDALQDFKAFVPEYFSKGRVLNFVAQPKRELMQDRPEDYQVLKKHGIEGPYFYLPNQFWKHKNHGVVFEALAILKKKGITVSLVCSGKMSDYRDETYFPKLKSFVETEGLSVKFLGLIDYDDVMVLMKKSAAVINPSLFEGWSSTVEECKVIGKFLILSDIKVHREQNPEAARYFDPKNPEELAAILADTKSPSVPAMNLEMKTREFSEKYLKILRESLQ